MILKKRGFFKFPKYKILANTYRYRYIGELLRSTFGHCIKSMYWFEN